MRHATGRPNASSPQNLAPSYYYISLAQNGAGSSADTQKPAWHSPQKAQYPPNSHASPSEGLL
eukprot:732899-Amphidinium_carterae.1